MTRFLYLDVIRILACLMIVVMHAPIPGDDWNGYVLATDSLLTAPGIGFFIMVSGALLLPVTMSTKDFLKRRLDKVVLPTLIWSLIYYIVAPWTDTVGRGGAYLAFFQYPSPHSLIVYYGSCICLSDYTCLLQFFPLGLLEPVKRKLSFT